MQEAHQYAIFIQNGDLEIELSSDDVYFITKQMDKWFRVLLDDSYVPVTLPKTPAQPASFIRPAANSVDDFVQPAPVSAPAPPPLPPQPEPVAEAPKPEPTPEVLPAPEPVAETPKPDPAPEVIPSPAPEPELIAETIVEEIQSPEPEVSEPDIKNDDFEKVMDSLLQDLDADDDEGDISDNTPDATLQQAQQVSQQETDAELATLFRQELEAATPPAEIAMQAPAPPDLMSKASIKLPEPLPLTMDDLKAAQKLENEDNFTSQYSRRAFEPEETPKIIESVITESRSESQTEQKRNDLELIGSLNDLCDRLNPESPETFLVLSAYYLTCYEAEEKFSLKRINSLLSKSGYPALNHSALEDALGKAFVAMVPDLTGTADVTEYTLTPQGQSLIEGLL
ncbi:MAG: hypothetical protein K2X01_02835 [Cyanobacteria bacterium]|nr:hypothetical protein [Cyanobacteriota bacterium]